MTFQEYLTRFESILNSSQPAAPYDNADYFNYTKLNWSRLNRWLKTGKLNEELVAKVKAITIPQSWIIITEPWCGDAAHAIPFLHMIAAENALIKVDYELRDSDPHRIDQYLTNGGKSIPKLIIKDGNGVDQAIWGPRPAECQLIYQQLMEQKADFETVKTALQKWYNEDKGVAIQAELLALIN